MKTLRPYKRCDGETVVKWILNERSFYLWSAGRLGEYPLTAERLNAFYDQEAENPEFMVFVACDEKGQPVGQLFMKYIDETKEKVRFGFIIVDPAIRGKGYGKKLLQFAKQYAVTFLGAHKISLGVFANNGGALHCYEAAGFRLTGECRRYELAGETWEWLEMEQKFE